MNTFMTASLALVTSIGLLLNWRFFGRRRTRLGIGLLLTMLGVAVLAVGNVEMIEQMATSLTVPGISTLVKDLALLTPLIGMLLFWSELRNFSRPQEFVMVAGLAVIAVYRTVVWQRGRELCAAPAVGYEFDNCALQDIPYAAGETLVLVTLSAAALITAWLLRSGTDWKSVSGRAVTVLTLACIVLSAWALVAALGVGDTLEDGALGSLQFALRPVLSSLGAILVVVATLMTPLAMLWQKASFRTKTRKLSNALSVMADPPDMAAANPVTAVMDHLGLVLDKCGIYPENSAGNRDANRVAAWLSGGKPTNFGVPRHEPIWQQRIWLLRVSDRLKDKSRVLQ